MVQRVFNMCNRELLPVAIPCAGPAPYLFSSLTKLCIVDEGREMRELFR